jgi:recombination protein RecA
VKSELDKLIKGLQKSYGDGTIMDLHDGNIPSIKRIPLTSPNLSHILGGGIPIGRIIELYGPESTGKSSIASYLSGQVQKYFFESKNRNGVVAYIDVEHAFDPSFAAMLGFDVQQSIFSQPDYGEQALNIAKGLAESGEIDFIVVDSVAALTPKAEVEGDMEDVQMGAMARMMGKGLRKLSSIASEKECTFLFINQVRDKIGGFSLNPNSQPSTTPGGNALKFFSSIRLEVRRKDWIGGYDQPKGIEIMVTSKKNKTAPPMHKHILSLLFDSGFDTDSEWVTHAIALGVVHKAGPWYTIPGLTEEKFQGQVQLGNFLQENKEVFDNLRETTYNLIVKGGE